MKKTRRNWLQSVAVFKVSNLAQYVEIVEVVLLGGPKKPEQNLLKFCLAVIIWILFNPPDALRL